MAAVTTMIRVATVAMLLRRGLWTWRLGGGARRLGLGAGGLCLRARCLRLGLQLRSGGLRLRTRLRFSLAACLLLRLSARGLCLCASLRVGLTTRLSLRLHLRLIRRLRPNARLIARGYLGGTRLFASAGLSLGTGSIGLCALRLPCLHLRALYVARLGLDLLPLSVALRRRDRLPLSHGRLACGTVGLRARHLARALLIMLCPGLLLGQRLLLLTLRGLRLDGGLTLLAEIARPIGLLACRLSLGTALLLDAGVARPRGRLSRRQRNITLIVARPARLLPCRGNHARWRRGAIIRLAPGGEALCIGLAANALFLPVTICYRRDALMVVAPVALPRPLGRPARL